MTHLSTADSDSIPLEDTKIVHRRSSQLQGSESTSQNVEHLIIIGPTNSGKTMIGRLLQTTLGITHIEASDVLQDLLVEEEREMTPHNIIDFLDATDGVGVAREVVSRIKHNNQKSTVITGFRKPEELEYARSSLSNVVIGRVVASRSKRLERALANSNIPADTAREKFQQKEHLEDELGLKEALKQFPEFEINNQGSMQQLHTQLPDIIMWFSVPNDCTHLSNTKSEMGGILLEKGQGLNWDWHR